METLSPPSALSFVSLNESQANSILLVHGGFSSHKEWTQVSKYLLSYHVLIPDLPGHGKGSSSSIPLTLDTSVILLAELVAGHARGGKADIVGLSFGGYAVLKLAATRPDLVRSVFASGCHLDWQGRWKNWAMGLGLSLDVGITRTVPKSWYMWTRSRIGMPISDESYEEARGSLPMAKGSRASGVLVAKELGTFELSTWDSVKPRTLLVVGSKEPYVDEAKRKGMMLRIGNENSRAARVEGMVHAWNLQEPRLFARGIVAWVEQEELPNEFVVLKGEK